MGQQEIIEILSKIHFPLSRADLSILLNDTVEKTSKHLKTLLHTGDIKSIEVDKDLSLKVFNSKRRLRLYYFDDDTIKNVKELFDSFRV